MGGGFAMTVALDHAGGFTGDLELEMMG